jgi:hypothetical protein
LPKQSCAHNNEGLYTIDGFVDEVCELDTSLACVKPLKRSPGFGPRPKITTDVNNAAWDFAASFSLGAS